MTEKREESKRRKGRWGNEAVNRDGRALSVPPARRAKPKVQTLKNPSELSKIFQPVCFLLCVCFDAPFMPDTCPLFQTPASIWMKNMKTNFLSHVVIKKASSMWRNLIKVGADTYWVKLFVSLRIILEPLDIFILNNWTLTSLSVEQKCILSEGEWFKPIEFERFGGKEKWKNSTKSILFDGAPLRKLIEVHKKSFN